MLKRWLPFLLLVMLGLLLLPASALAQNRNPNWGNRRWAANRNYRNGAWGNRNRSWGNRGWGYRNNGYYGNPNYGRGRYWGYGDRDGYRHRWYGDDDDDDGGYYGGWGNRGWGWGNNGRWNGSTPPGWQHGRKTGWGNSNLPPGLAKKGGWW